MRDGCMRGTADENADMRGMAVEAADMSSMAVEAAAEYVFIWK